MNSGFPDQPMLDFFVTVWTVNRGLDLGRQIRIVFVDIERPWEKIQKREDWAPYDVDRDTSAGRLPAIPYTLTLKDGSILQGVVPMLYDPLTDRWGGYTGLDWHVTR